MNGNQKIFLFILINTFLSIMTFVGVQIGLTWGESILILFLVLSTVFISILTLIGAGTLYGALS